MRIGYEELPGKVRVAISTRTPTNFNCLPAVERREISKAFHEHQEDTATKYLDPDTYPLNEGLPSNLQAIRRKFYPDISLHVERNIDPESQEEKVTGRVIFTLSPSIRRGVELLAKAEKAPLVGAKIQKLKAEVTTEGRVIPVAAGDPVVIPHTRWARNFSECLERGPLITEVQGLIYVC